MFKLGKLPLFLTKILAAFRTSNCGWNTEHGWRWIQKQSYSNWGQEGHLWRCAWIHPSRAGKCDPWIQPRTYMQILNILELNVRRQALQGRLAGFIYVTDWMFLRNRTTSMPKSVLLYVVDKVKQFVLIWGLVFQCMFCMNRTTSMLKSVLRYDVKNTI